MSLSDVMSHLELSVYAEVGLVLFFGVFVSVTARVLRASRDEMRANAALPLEDGDPGSAEKEA